MFKNVLLAGALLVPVLAYGGSPNTDLSVQIVPAASTTPPPSSPTPPPPPPPPPPTSGSCGAAPVGAAAADATAAGFTTCALYSDWTYGTPNSVGTGLPSNWLDCGQNGGDNPNADWTFGMSWVNQGNTLPCTVGGNSSNSNVFEDTDNTGNLALHVLMTAAQLNGALNTWILSTGPYTWNTPADDAHLGTPASWNYPDGIYVEISWEGSDPNPNVGYGNGIAFWDFGASAYGSCQANTELDFMEQTGTGNATFNTHNWSTNCGNNSPNSYWFSTNVTSYQTYGWLVTNDGNNNLAVCIYLNGMRQSCQSMGLLDSEGEVYERRPMWFAAGDSLGTATGQMDTWIKYIKVYTCPNWLVQNNLAVSSCSGSANNGNFFVPSSQQSAPASLKHTSPRHLKD
jgi:hypothetical protein